VNRLVLSVLTMLVLFALGTWTTTDFAAARTEDRH
jgi:hypothetical protein